MRAVIQRVSRAQVRVGEEIAGNIGRGLLIFLGVARSDSELDASWMASKIAALRIFEDTEGKLNRSVLDTGESVLVVSQFTLLGDGRKGNRPSFQDAASPEEGERLYSAVCRLLEEAGLSVARGRFRATMDVELVNHGPVTILLDSKKMF